jgi:hypothetical protein
MKRRFDSAHLRATRPLLVWIAAALILTLAPTAASARDLPDDGMTINDVVGWLQGAGYSAEIVPDKDGAQHVRTSIGGTNFGVYMFDCKDARCGSIQFAAGFATHGAFDISRMNQWNRENRWARGYYDSVNDPWVEMDVDLTPGGTYELLNDELATWNNSLKRFVGLYDLK